MKKPHLFLMLFIFTETAFSAENLVLSCEGTVIGVVASGSNNEKELTPIKIVDSYSFKDGKLLKGRKVVNCTWTDEQIQCEDVTGNPHSINRLVSINRITGYIDAMTSYLDGKGVFIRRDMFTGICKETKRKF